MDSVLADINIDDPSAIAGAEDAISAPGVTAAATEAEVRAKASKKDKKDKKSKRKSDAMEVDEQALPTADEDVEKAAKKARKEEKKRRRQSEGAAAEEPKEKKKKRKST